jgi:hypothetical protein
VFENDEHFEKKRDPNLSVRAVPDGPDYNLHTMPFLKHPKILVYDEK